MGEQTVDTVSAARAGYVPASALAAANARIVDLEAQNAALVEALTEIREVRSGRYTTSRHPEDIITAIIDRALLAQQPGPSSDPR
jgi:hypothetical protein